MVKSITIGKIKNILFIAGLYIKSIKNGIGIAVFSGKTPEFCPVMAVVSCR
jgi:hypothetical protein